MIIDSSVLIALLMKEPEQFAISDAMMLANVRRVSAPTLLEAAMVSEARGDQGGADLDKLVARFGIQIVDFTAEHALLAREAFRRYGKGRHPAQLNFGDCMAYALAKATNEPLLFKGADFSQTDVEAVMY